MKKLKILLPILSASTVLAVSAPVLTSCSKMFIDDDVYDLALQIFKSQALKKINSACAEALGKQPEIANKLKELLPYCLSCAQQCTYFIQAMAIGGLAGYFEGAGRQPEAISAMQPLVYFSACAILSQPNDKSLGLNPYNYFEAMARQPEAIPQIMAAYVEAAETILSN